MTKLSRMVILLVLFAGITIVPHLAYSVVCDDWAYTEYEVNSSGTCPAPSCSCQDLGPWTHKWSTLMCRHDDDPDCGYEDCIGDSISLYDIYACKECPECYYEAWEQSETCYVCPDNAIPSPT